MRLDPADLYRDLRENAFAPGALPARPPRVGAEVELIPVDAVTRAALPVHAAEGPSSLPFVRSFAARRGWREEPSPYGAPRWVLPDGGILSYEPGGQLELSAPPLPSVSALLRTLRAAVVPLRSEAREEGIEMLCVGIDPVNGVESIPLQLPGWRYARMTEFMERIGTGGTRMMRQTAAIQVNLDWGPDPALLWRVLNAAAPHLIATFANSPRYRGAATGERSFRARVWRELDGARTGIFRGEDDAVAEYLEFALRAPAILLPFEAPEHAPFGEWNEHGCVTMDDWRTHLTTLFPEVRPRGFVEVRSPDALPPEWYAAPLVLLAGIAYHPITLRAARELLGDPDPVLLEHAGRSGLSDPRIGPVARDLFEVALEGAAALGAGMVEGEHLEEARAYFDRYTRRGRSPADDSDSGKEA